MLYFTITPIALHVSITDNFNCRTVFLFLQVMVRLYLFSLIWWPMTQLSTLLSTAWLCYLPFYIDLAEFNGWRISESVRQGTGICGRISTYLKSYFRCQLVKTVDIEKQCIFGIHPHGMRIALCSKALVPTMICLTVQFVC